MANLMMRECHQVDASAGLTVYPTSLPGCGAGTRLPLCSPAFFDGPVVFPLGFLVAGAGSDRNSWLMFTVASVVALLSIRVTAQRVLHPT
ncbi:MAG: hypothetical protein HQK58_14370 [Deltaproteobacteria bacterium]|nr:hypothetical protein [Deltaproteobacteria bacterium]